MSFCSIETFASLAFVSCHLDCISAASLLKSIRPQTLYSFCVYWRTSHSFAELNSLLCLPVLGSHTQYCFPTLFSKVTISKELLLPPNLLQVLLYLTFFNWKTKVTELCIKYRWLGQVYLGGVGHGRQVQNHGKKSGSNYNSGRSDSDFSRRWQEGWNKVIRFSIYISTAESISFADRFNVKEKVLYKGWLETYSQKNR